MDIEMGIATITVTEGALPPRPQSPKLGNFKEIFKHLSAGLSSGQVLTIQSVPTTSPPPMTSPSTQLVPFTGGFFGGLDFSTIEPTIPSPKTPQTCSFSSDDDDDSAKQSGSSVHDSYSTATSSPPSSSEKNAPRLLVNRAVRNTSNYISLPILGGGGRYVGHVTIPADVPTHRLVSTQFYQFAPLRVDPNCVPPLYVSTKQSKVNLLETRLFYQYQLDAKVRGTFGPITCCPIHIFVDLSNIIIGFYDRLKLDRGMSLQKKIRAPPFFFEGFARILERGRITARKVIAGSAMDNADRSKWPIYMCQAEACGYEMNILSRVTKTQISPRRRPRRGTKFNNDYTTSDPNSSDDGYPTSQLKQGEQAVDEILHLKMCHSVLDHEPSTIVLATGDAAVAEFSDGFLKHVERALDRGWCVELLSWSKGISSSWRELQRNPKWGDRFRIIELDTFVDELFAVFIDE